MSQHNVSTVPAISRLEIKVRQQTKQMKIKCYIFDIKTVLHNGCLFKHESNKNDLSWGLNKQGERSGIQPDCDIACATS